MKKCSKCKVEKPETEFHKKRATKGGLNAACRTCVAEYQKKHWPERRDRYSDSRSAYAKARRKQINARTRLWRKKNIERERIKERLREYHFSIAQYQELLEKQKHLCAICSGPMLPVCLDHCHATGAVRGLLCRKCNAGIGQLQDSLDIVHKAWQYLKLFSNSKKAKE